jgi:hypothetical protein
MGVGYTLLRTEVIHTESGLLVKPQAVSYTKTRTNTTPLNRGTAEEEEVNFNHNFRHPYVLYLNYRQLSIQI